MPAMLPLFRHYYYAYAAAALMLSLSFAFDAADTPPLRLR